MKSGNPTILVIDSEQDLVDVSVHILSTHIGGARFEGRVVEARARSLADVPDNLALAAVDVYRSQSVHWNETCPIGRMGIVRELTDRGIPVVPMTADADLGAILEECGLPVFTKPDIYSLARLASEAVTDKERYVKRMQAALARLDKLALTPADEITTVISRGQDDSPLPEMSIPRVHEIVGSVKEAIIKATPCILVVDDEEGVRDVFKNFAREKLPSYGCADGAEAIAAAEDNTSIRLVIVDLGLKGLVPSLEVARFYTEKNVPVIFASGDIDKNPQLSEALKETGAISIAKPVKFSEFSAIMDDVLANPSVQIERMRQAFAILYQGAPDQRSGIQIGDAAGLLRRTAPTPVSRGDLAGNPGAIVPAPKGLIH